MKDAEEQSVDDFVQGVDFALMQMKSETLLKIDEAIKRLDNGSYGMCADCGVEIAAARLAALPFAARCRACQEQPRTGFATRARGKGLRAAAEGARERHAPHRRPRRGGRT